MRGLSSNRGGSRVINHGGRVTDLGSSKGSSIARASHQLEEEQFDLSVPIWSASVEGMEDLTHLQGCGGWPKSAARNQ